MTVADIRSIINSTGSIIIDAAQYTSADLRSFATTASSKNAKVYLKNISGITAADLRSIATAGKGAVIFDFTE